MIEPDFNECLAVLRYTAQPTLGYNPPDDIHQFIMEKASEHSVRLALATCVLMARRALGFDVQQEEDEAQVQPVQTRLF